MNRSMDENRFAKGKDGRVHIAGCSLTGDSATLCGLFTEPCAQGGFEEELDAQTTIYYKKATPTCPECLNRIKDVLDIADIRTLRKWIKQLI